MNEKQREQAESRDEQSGRTVAPAQMRRTRVTRGSKGRPEIVMPASIARGMSVPRMLGDLGEDD